MQPTDIIIDFTTGLSGSVAWPWPIVFVPCRYFRRCSGAGSHSEFIQPLSRGYSSDEGG